MAEGFARNLADQSVNVFSAGSKPSGIVNPKAIIAMEECGINISNQSSNGLDSLPNIVFDWVVTMGCGDNCPFLKTKNRIDWQLKDPKNLPAKEFNAIRDEIKTRVTELLKSESALG